MSYFNGIKAKLFDGLGNAMSSVLTESGRALNVYQTASNGSVGTHLHVENLGTGTYTFILVDISDTANYKHNGGVNFAHMQSYEFGISCDTNGEWSASLGFIEDVTTSGSTEYTQDHWSGAKDTGNDMQVTSNQFPVGPQMNSDYLATHKIVLSTDFQSDVQARSTIGPDSPDTFPGDGDVFLKLAVTNGNVKELKFNIGYHSH